MLLHPNELSITTSFTINHRVKANMESRSR